MIIVNLNPRKYTKRHCLYSNHMRYLKCSLLFGFLTILFSCGPTVTFDQPQPIGKDNLSEFPKKLHGNFQSLKDNSVLNLTDKAIYRIYDFDFKIHINQLDSNYRISSDTVTNLED